VSPRCGRRECGGVYPLGSGASRVRVSLWQLSPLREWTSGRALSGEERGGVGARTRGQADKEQDKAELKVLLRRLERKDRAERIMHTGFYAFAAVLGCATALYLSTRGYNLGTSGGARSLPSPLPPASPAGAGDIWNRPGEETFVFACTRRWEGGAQRVGGRGEWPRCGHSSPAQRRSGSEWGGVLFLIPYSGHVGGLSTLYTPSHYARTSHQRELCYSLR